MARLAPSGSLLLALAALAGCLASLAAESVPALTPAGIPACLYRAERSTLVFSGPNDLAVTASLDERELAQVVITRERAELNLILPGPGVLRVTGGEREFRWRVVAPEENLELAARHGSLFTADGLPVLLLAWHKLPPPLDRTWETLLVLQRLWRDERPPLARLHLAGATWLPGAECQALPAVTGVPAGFWHPLASAATTHEVTGVLPQLLAGSLPAGWLLAPGMEDLEHGLSPTLWRMHWEFALQALAAREVGPVFLLAPPMSSRQQRRFPQALAEMRLAAQANGAVFLNAFLERQTDGLRAQDLSELLLPRLQTYLRVQP